ncbi:MAG: cytochrome-c oxidase, cbb3-type subunit III [Burkholderiaceae bacterium]
MSDFTSSFWSLYVAVITLAGIAGCAVLLWVTSRKPVQSHGEDNTTGHIWDGDLREANNPMPMWWVGLFIITVIFGILYLILYPGLGTFAGQLGWSSRGQYEAEVAAANERLNTVYAQYASTPIDKLARDTAAMGIGERLFMNNCAQCHGSDARGGKGFPNLTDKDWLHGGSPEKIVESITKGRVGVMPPMAAAVGSTDDVANVAQYVLSLSGSPHDSLRAQLGREKFATCAACHGSKGEGNPLLGAPNLTDKIWLHGYGANQIVSMITNGKSNEMPAQEGRLTTAQIHVLSAYVWGLSNPSVVASH